MTIDLRQLRFAVTAADTASFLRAAKQLNVKQSTLSKKVSALEHRLGITLFERSTRGVVPTENGKAFLEVARRIVTDADNLLTTAKAMTYGEVGRLMVGFSGSLNAGNLRLLLGDLLERYPDVQLDALEAGPDRLLSGLQARIVDIAIHSSPVDELGIVKRWLWAERLMVVLPKHDRLTESDSLFWTDLRKSVFVMPRDRSGPRISEVIRQRLGSHGFKANIITQDTSAETIAAMVPFGKFITVVPESATGAARPDIVFREISEPTGAAHLDFAAWWREDNDNPALARFFKLLDERYPLTTAG
ncbi:MAG: LysR family transcriptional regulator [Sphingomonas sp.]|nr:LysR family transcriptional regulator [Sphingomonas sp.]